MLTRVFIVVLHEFTFVQISRPFESSLVMLSKDDILEARSRERIRLEQSPSDGCVQLAPLSISNVEDSIDRGRA